MNTLAKLKDIKSVEFIAVDFMPYFIGFTLFVLFIIFAYLIYLYIKNAKKKPSKEQISKTYLKKMDFKNDSKSIAYDFTIHSKICLFTKIYIFPYLCNLPLLVRMYSVLKRVKV